MSNPNNRPGGFDFSHFVLLLISPLDSDFRNNQYVLLVWFQLFFHNQSVDFIIVTHPLHLYAVKNELL